MDVGRWLRGLGLGQYETNFRDNKINADLLPRLTNDDLKDIGVSALGDRRQLLDAIAALAGTKPTADASASQSGPTPPKGPAISAERRPITVMFCDLVGSTSLAANLDAEDWRTLVNTYLEEASAAVTSLGGHVLKKLGDGLMAVVSEQFFGPPLTVVALGHAQPLPIFQQLARSDPSGRNDVRAIATVAAQRRGSAGRACDRHQP